MEIDPEKLRPREMYHWLISTVLPRPIAWVSSLSANGGGNLAPFSFFNAITSNPPTLLFCPANRRDGSKKDTLLNVEATKEFVVNVVPYSLAEAMNTTSAEFAPDQDEFDMVKIERAPSVKVKPPRVKLAPVHFECVLHQIVTVGEGALGGNVVIGRIVWMSIHDSVLNEKKEIDPRKLDAIGRMGGMGYARTTDLFEIQRPDIKS